MRRLCALLLVSSLALAQDAEALLGRLLILAFSGSEAPVERLNEFQPAGFLLYPSNVPSSIAVRTLTSTLQAQAPYPLLFGIDQEGGAFTTYRVDNATMFPGNMVLGATGDLDLARQVGWATGRELHHLGINLNFAPVVDVNSNPDNPIIGIRSFGADPQTVGEMGVAYLEGLLSAGVAGVAKHLPGHGDTQEDSHLTLPTITRDRAGLESLELAPFRTIIAGGVPAIMTAHVVFPALEPDLPATLSPRILTGLLREELGFTGVIITDYMDMQAISDNYGAGEAAVQSVIAGADLVLLGQDLEVQREVLNALREALRDGRLSEARVREAVARSESLAQRYPSAVSPAPDYALHKALAQEVADRGVTLLWQEEVLPLEPTARVLVIAPQPRAFGVPPHLGEMLERHHPNVSRFVLPTNPSEEDIQVALAAAEGADVVVLGVYYWLGTFSPNLSRLGDALMQRQPLVMVTLGNPDVLRYFGAEARAYIAAYGYREGSLEAAAKLLTGNLTPQGRLPTPVGVYPIGAGMRGLHD